MQLACRHKVEMCLSWFNVKYENFTLSSTPFTLNIIYHLFILLNYSLFDLDNKLYTNKLVGPQGGVALFEPFMIFVDGYFNGFINLR